MILKQPQIPTAAIGLTSDELDLLSTFCKGYFPDDNYPLATSLMSVILDKLDKARATLPLKKAIWSFDYEGRDKK